MLGRPRLSKQRIAEGPSHSRKGHEIPALAAALSHFDSSWP